MSMTPDEYAARELNVPGWMEDELLYAPQAPSMAELFGQVPPTPSAPVATQEQEQPMAPNDQAKAMEMSFEYNFTLPLQLRRTELLTEATKIGHLSARTLFWNALSFSVLLTPILVFVAVLVK
jgi:hypothetical protein